MATEINDVTKIQIRNASNGDFDLILGGSQGDDTLLYPVLVMGGNSYLNRYVSSYTQGTCRTHIEVNGKLCPIYIVKMGSREYEVLQVEKGSGQPYTYAYYRLTRDENMNVTDIEYLKFQLNITDISSILASETIYKRKDGGMFRAYYWDTLTETYKWIGAIGSPVKWAVARHEENLFSIYAQVSADQFIQVTNIDSQAYTLNTKFYVVEAIEF